MTYGPLGPPVRQMTESDRRQFLRGLSGTAAALVLAGCLGGDDASDDQDSGDTESSGDEGADSTHPDDTGGEEGDSEDDPATPENFEDVDQLRDHTRSYIELLSAGEYETAAAWVDPEVAPFLDADLLETVWEDTVGAGTEVDSYRTVAYLGTETGNHTFIVRTEIASEPFEFVFSFSPAGIQLFEMIPLTGWSPPAYADPAAILEESVTLETPLQCSLGGTLTRPDPDAQDIDADEQIPGVVLVHGNGPQGRDGAVGPNRPFKELAWGLANNGIAVLRYDKRTFACKPDIANATIDDIVTDDALTAIDRLRAQDHVDDEAISVAGLSFGGLLAPRIAALDGRLASVVMLAPGPARPFGETILNQMEHVLDLQGALGPQRDEALAEVESEAERIDTLAIDDDDVIRYGGLEYYKSLQEYDHTAAVAGLSIPRLILQGGQDWQITVEDDLPIWRDALEDDPAAEITVYDELNHLFQVSEGQRTQQEYAEPDSPVDERVIDDIASFIWEATADEVAAPKIAPSRR